MTYTLKRCPITKKGSLFMEVIFDLWNDEFQTGYEIKVVLYNQSAWYTVYFNELRLYLHRLCGLTYDISRWDKIIRDIKQQKMKDWVIYE